MPLIASFWATCCPIAERAVSRLRVTSAWRTLVTNPFLEPQVEPVRVIETIPVAGTTDLPPETAAAEKIPTPSHLLVGRALARGGMGHVHPAMDRNLLRKVALKRLDKE